MKHQMSKLFNWLWILLPIALPSYVIRFNIGPIPTTLLEIFILFLIFIWLLENKIRGIKKAWKYLGIWRYPLITWLGATLLSVLIASDKWGALGYWRAFMFEPAIIFAIILEQINQNEIKKSILQKNILYGIAIITVLLGLYSIYQFFTGFGIPSPWNISPGRRSTGVFGFPNGLSLFMAPFGVICLITWLKSIYDEDNIWFRILMPLAWVLAGASEILAKSMGGLLAFGVGTVLILILHKKTRIFGLILAIIGFLGAGYVAFNVYNTELHPQTIEFTVASTKKWSSLVRTIIWRESLELALAHPVLGYGLRSYKTAIVPYHTATWMEIYPHPHNIVLMLWIETGFLGMLAFFWIIITWFQIILCSKKEFKCSVDDATKILWLIPLIAILVHGMVDMPYFKNDLAMQFWILAALATAYSLKTTKTN